MDFLSDPLVILGLGGLGIIVGGAFAWFRAKKKPAPAMNDQDAPEGAAPIQQNAPKQG